MLVNIFDHFKTISPARWVWTSQRVEGFLCSFEPWQAGRRSLHFGPWETFSSSWLSSSCLSSSWLSSSHCHHLDCHQNNVAVISINKNVFFCFFFWPKKNDQKKLTQMYLLFMSRSGCSIKASTTWNILINLQFCNFDKKAIKGKNFRRHLGIIVVHRCNQGGVPLVGVLVDQHVDDDDCNDDDVIQ